MAALDISYIKNISGSSVVIGSTTIVAGAKVYAFYKPEYFSYNAGDLQQALTQGFIECYGTDGSLLSLADTFEASSRAADFLSMGGVSQGKMWELTVSSNVT